MPRPQSHTLVRLMDRVEEQIGIAGVAGGEVDELKAFALGEALQHAILEIRHASDVGVTQRAPVVADRLNDPCMPQRVEL